jgi:quinone-modifying oxidoreductase subunit QmoC
LKEILLHQQLRKCETSRTRYTAHLLIFYGFIGLLVTTAVVAAVVILSKPPFNLFGEAWHLPWGLDHPIRGFFKILGNLSGIAVVAGCVIAIVQRVRGRRETGKLGNWETGKLGNQPQPPKPDFLISQLPSTTYWDWLFVSVLGGVAATGLLVQFSRLVSVGAVPYVLYALHLFLVFFLLAYFPHSKFAHLIYRIVAKVHAKVYDRQGEREA